MSKPMELGTRCGECLLYGAIQGMADGMILVDPDERIFHLNRRAQELLELGSRHVIGTKLSECHLNTALARFWEDASKEFVPVTSDLEFPSGESVRATVSLCLSASREPIGRALMLRDVTREKRISVELSASVARRLVEMVHRDPPEDEDMPPLTSREEEILRLLVEGLTNAEIAARLCVSVNTVASHLKHLFSKLEVTSRAQATAYAVSHGLRPGRR